MIIKIFINKYLRNYLKKKFDETKNLTNELSHDYSIYYIKNDTAER